MDDMQSGSTTESPSDWFFVTGKTNAPPPSSSRFLRAMHPKSEIRADRTAIRKILALGWVGQLKIHGHRAQIHIPACTDVEPVAYNRKGQIHKKLLPPAIVAELRRLFGPAREWNVIDAEWIKGENKLFVFDFLKKDGAVLDDKAYPERYRLLPTDFLSPHVRRLPLIKSVEKCIEALGSVEDWIEGLVFKSTASTGFADTSIVRCRKTPKRS